MLTSHASSAAQALFRVFVLPTLPAVRQPASRAQSSRQLRSTASRSFTTTRIRHAKARPPEQRAQKWNDEIQSQRIFLVHPETNALDLRTRWDILNNLNTNTHRLIQVGERPDPHDPHGQNKFPVCKILDKKEMYQQEKNRKAAQKEAKKASATASSVKTLELNWAIDGNDLAHRLDRMQDFLAEGRRVEVVLAAKKRGRKANAAECEDVLRRIRETVDAVPGAREAKALEGRLGGFCTLRFQGKAAPEQAQNGGQQKEQEAAAASVG